MEEIQSHIRTRSHTAHVSDTEFLERVLGGCRPCVAQQQSGLWCVAAKINRRGLGYWGVMYEYHDSSSSSVDVGEWEHGGKNVEGSLLGGHKMLSLGRAALKCSLFFKRVLF